MKTIHTFITTQDTLPSFCGSFVEINTNDKFLRWNDIIVIPSRFTNRYLSQKFMCVPPKNNNNWKFLPLDVKTKIKKIIPKGTKIMVVK
jgi:hypothetical protein